MSHESRTREHILELGAEYNTLILRLDRVSDEFLRDLEDSGIEAAHGLLESRSVLCTELAECGETLRPLVRELERTSSGADAELRGLLADIRANLLSLNEKQSACESALSARMDECRTELSSLRRHDELRGAYHGSSQEQNARFLDSLR